MLHGPWSNMFRNTYVIFRFVSWRNYFRFISVQYLHGGSVAAVGMCVCVCVCVCVYRILLPFQTDLGVCMCVCVCMCVFSSV